jgi:hypothetical protein
MRISVRRIIPFALLIGANLAHADLPPMSGYMGCARAMGVAINEKFAIIPGEQSGDKGLFVYTDQGVFFLPRGAPQIEDAEAHEFFLRTKISRVGEIFLVFREKKRSGDADNHSSIGYQTTPPNKDAHNYRATPAIDSPGDQARRILSKRLKEKVAGVKDFIDEKNSFSTPGEAKAAFEKDRVIYRAKLETCRLEGDRDLRSLVSEEVQKLESGFPGATIWELQIGGKPPNIQSRNKVSGIY